MGLKKLRVQVKGKIGLRDFFPMQGFFLQKFSIKGVKMKFRKITQKIAFDSAIRFPTKSILWPKVFRQPTSVRVKRPQINLISRQVFNKNLK